MPEISVIIPCYNCEDTILHTVHSVQAQSFSDFECILVDDCSTDQTWDILQSITDERFKNVRHDMNKGAAGARNTAIRLAKGRYIALLDSDDVWHVQKLKTQHFFMEKNPTFPASCTSFNIYRDPVRAIPRLLKPKKNWLKEMLTVCNVSPGSTLMAQRNLFSAGSVGLFPEDMRRFEDWQWLIEYCYHFDLGIVEDILSDVRLTGYARYENIVVSSNLLYKKQSTKIKNRLGTFPALYFKASLEYEKAFAAYHENKKLTALMHSLKIFIISPLRFFRAIERILKKVMSRDYSREKVKAYK
ncbi:MAG: glycosyltransferase family 2 protein [Alphaproteobacteria bacterium]|nr:glycosyltransferase family 2 protein [Alphaproteobacteria bacterium]